MDAPFPLLSTKLFVPPPRPTLVARPRLVERLSQGLTLPLTLISAPAGFGKTTLVSEWRATNAGRDYPLAWRWAMCSLVISIARRAVTDG